MVEVKLGQAVAQGENEITSRNPVTEFHSLTRSSTKSVKRDETYTVQVAALLTQVAGLLFSSRGVSTDSQLAFLPM